MLHSECWLTYLKYVDFTREPIKVGASYKQEAFYANAVMQFAEQIHVLMSGSYNGKHGGDKC